ncbi:MAG TPA: hypothetical protein VHV31_04020, partial [Nitrolancea sp.]|nr:hypothetical protein [Nitrolancea sp.]
EWWSGRFRPPHHIFFKGVNVNSRLDGNAPLTAICKTKRPSCQSSDGPPQVSDDRGAVILNEVKDLLAGSPRFFGSPRPKHPASSDYGT